VIMAPEGQFARLVRLKADTTGITVHLKVDTTDEPDESAEPHDSYDPHAPYDPHDPFRPRPSFCV
jgi:hypothetical protein